MVKHHKTIREIIIDTSYRNPRNFDYSARVVEDTGGPALELTIHFKDISKEPFCYWFSTRDFSDANVDWLAGVLINMLEAIATKTHGDVMSNIHQAKKNMEEVLENGHLLFP